jgi:NADPH2:quinone reductase
MHAIVAATYGGPEVMQLVELPAPQPGPGQALVRIEAAGVNFIDTYQRSGQYQVGLPVRLGLEGAGVVEAVGPDGGGPAPGTRVAWTGVPGSYATHNLVPVDRLVELPAAVSAEIGAAAMLQGMTAHYLTQSTFPLGAGHDCLIHAAAGGVGQLLCQLARRAGARAIGTVSTPAKAELARKAGAEAVILYTEEEIEPAVRRLTGGRGVHVVYDSVGKTTFQASLASLAPRGMLVLFGQSSGPVPPFDPQLLNQRGSLYLTRPALHHYTHDRAELVARAADVLGWIGDGELEIAIGARFPLAAAAEAHRQLEGRATTGKVLLLP